MAPWLLPALKAMLPHVGSIISAAAPVFTRMKTGAAADPATLAQEQIAELQAAASQNATNIRELAAQLQTTLAALEQAAALAEARIRRALWLCAVAALLCAAALGLAAYVLLAR